MRHTVQLAFSVAWIGVFAACSGSTVTPNPDGSTDGVSSDGLGPDGTALDALRGDTGPGLDAPSDIVAIDGIANPDTLGVDTARDVVPDNRLCAPGFVVCGAACVDVTSDPMNCGACGVRCGAPQVCNGGACSSTCSAGLQTS